MKEGVEEFIETDDADDQQLAAALNALGVTGSRFVMCERTCQWAPRPTFCLLPQMAIAKKKK